MRTYNIVMMVNGEEKIQRWSGYGEQSAIAQAMLSEAQQGAREIKIIDIIEIQ